MPRVGGRGQLAAGVFFALALVGAVSALKSTAPQPPRLARPAPVHQASNIIPYYEPPPRIKIPEPHAVPHTTLVGGPLPSTGPAPSELSAFAAMGAVLDHYCLQRGAGARSLRPLAGYRHVLAIVNPPWAHEIDIELWWTGHSYRWQAQSGPLGGCSVSTRQ